MPFEPGAALPSHPSEFACIDLVNSSFSDYLGGPNRFDRLADEGWQAWFVARHGIAPDASRPVPVDRLLALRRDLGRILADWAAAGTVSSRGARSLDRWVSTAVVRYRVRQRGGTPELGVEPVTSDWSWTMAAVARSAVELMASGDPARLKVCRNPHCSWLFYDRTPNLSKQFCATNPCANLVRVRRFRERAPTTPGSRSYRPDQRRQPSG